MFVGESTLTWLSARADCKRRGGDLLIVDQLEDMFEILPYIRTKRNHWIGAFNHVWQFQSGILVCCVVVVVMSEIHPISGSIDRFLSSDGTGCKNVLSASIIEKIKRTVLKSMMKLCCLFVFFFCVVTVHSTWGRNTLMERSVSRWKSMSVLC